jgi:heparan-alpha-glucosaminide N-acetyltransferase
MNSSSQTRVASIDILRALTMVLMIFVNDLWSLTGIPGWLEHTAAAEDGMGLADTVFPAFLFITGMSIPLAVEYRRSLGDSQSKILWHILMRSIALLTMGLFLVNGEYLNEEATGISRGFWNCISCVCFILLWNSWPKSINKHLLIVLRVTAIIALLSLAWIARNGEVNEIGRFSTFWWGILGLIGWAYLVTASMFVFMGDHIWKMLTVWIFFLVLCIASHAEWLQGLSMISIIISPLGDGAMPALVSGGVLTTMLFLQFRRANQNAKIFWILAVIAVVLIALGFYTRTFWGISKIRATPAWVLICSALTIICFLVAYWLADLKQKEKWFTVIKPAGTSTLLCYLLPYFAYAIVISIGLTLPEAILSGYAGLLKSLLFSLLIVVLAGQLARVGLKLKL